MTPFFASSSLSFARKPILGSCTWPPKSGFRSSGQESPHSRPVLQLNLCSKPNAIQILFWLSHLTIIEHTQYSDTNSGDAEGNYREWEDKVKIRKTLGCSCIGHHDWIQDTFRNVTNNFDENIVSSFTLFRAFISFANKRSTFIKQLPREQNFSSLQDILKLSSLNFWLNYFFMNNIILIKSYFLR